MRTAVSTDWKNREPIPSRHSLIPLDRSFSVDEMNVIRTGLIPEEMEDKWFIYFEDGKLFFHRSWTGYCNYVVRFVDEGGAARMVEALASRDPEQYKGTSDAHDKKMVSFLIDNLLLHYPAEFPSRKESPEVAALRQWSSVGQAMFGKHPDSSQHSSNKSTWKHSDVFPIIARIINDLYETKEDYVTHDEVSTGLKNDTDGSTFIQQAADRMEESQTAEWIAHNMVAWFSQRISVGKSAWEQHFDRKKIEKKWAYRPKAKSNY